MGGRDCIPASPLAVSATGVPEPAAARSDRKAACRMGKDIDLRQRARLTPDVDDPV